MVGAKGWIKKSLVDDKSFGIYSLATKIINIVGVVNLEHLVSARLSPGPRRGRDRCLLDSEATERRRKRSNSRTKVEQMFTQ